MNSFDFKKCAAILNAYKFRISMICMFVVLIATFFSCAKQDEVTPNSISLSDGQKIVPRSPSYISDRLYFTDYDEFEEYFIELDSILENYPTLFDSIVITNTPVTTVYMEAADDGAYTTFLSDPIMKAIVNPNYEFQIDDVLVTFINNGEILASDASNGTLKSAIRAISKGVALDITEIPVGAFWGRPNDIEQSIKIGCGCKIYIRPSGCENVRVFGSCNGLFGSEGEGDVTVTFNTGGLGGPQTVLDEDVEGNFEFFINISHFSTSGLFTALVDPNCQLASNQSAIFPFDPSTFASCDEEHRTNEQEVNSGNERMKMITSYYENILAYYHKAELRSYTWNGTKWEGTRANLSVEVDANRRSIGCDLLDSKNDDKSCNSCRSQIVRVSWTSPCAHCDDVVEDLIGSYQKIKSGVTLNSDLAVDFECCQ